MVVERVVPPPVAPFLNITGLTQEQYDAIVVMVRWGLIASRERFDGGTKWSRIVEDDMLMPELERCCTA